MEQIRVVNNSQISSTERLLNTIRRRGTEESLPEPEQAPNLRSRLKHSFGISKSRDYIGVEIFRDSLNLVCMNYSKTGWYVAQAASVPLTSDTNLQSPDFTQLIKKQFQIMGVDRQSQIWFCLPAAKGEIWNVLVPKIRKGLDNAVYWASRKERSFDPKEYIFDYRIRGEHTDQDTSKLWAEVCIASKQDIEFYQQLFWNIGYPLQGITFPTLALENIFRNKWIQPRQEAFAVLYIAPDCSYIAIQDTKRILLSRVIKTGQDSILDEFKSQEGIGGYLEIDTDQPPASSQQDHSDSSTSRKQIEQIMQSLQDNMEQQDASSSGYSAENVLTMIRPALQRLARQIERTMDHSVNVQNNPAPECIYLCGRITGLPGLPEFFQEQLGMDVVLLDALHPDLPQVSPELSALEKHQRLALVSAAGLALPTAQSINFLHTAKDRAREKSAQRKANSVAVACALLFVLAAGYWWYSNQEIRQNRAEVARLEQELQQYQPLLSQDKIIEMAQTTQKEQEKMRHMSRNLFPAAVIQEVNQSTPSHIQLLSLEMDLGGPEQSSNQEQKELLILQGFINNAPERLETHLASYLQRLQRSPFFSEVRIQDSLREQMSAQEEVYKFTLKITLEKV